jgi:hypothetical protein
MAIVELHESAPIADSNELEDQREGPTLDPGVRVEVRRRFDAKWSRGFEVQERCGDLYRLRRLSDGATLPVLFAAEDVRREHRRNTWWY